MVVDIKKLFSGMEKSQKQVLILAVVGTVAVLFGYFNLLLSPQLSGIFRNANKVRKVG